VSDSTESNSACELTTNSSASASDSRTRPSPTTVGRTRRVDGKPSRKWRNWRSISLSALPRARICCRSRAVKLISDGPAFVAAAPLALALVGDALFELECGVEDVEEEEEEEDDEEDDEEEEEEEDEEDGGDGGGDGDAPAAAAEATEEATSVAGESPTKNETTTMASASTISVGSNSREHTDVQPLVLLALPALLLLLLPLLPLLLFACACRRALLVGAPDAVVAADVDVDKGRFARLIIACGCCENWQRVSV